jgi:hypothetical protein
MSAGCTPSREFKSYATVFVAIDWQLVGFGGPGTAEQAAIERTSPENHRISADRPRESLR